MDSLDTFTSNPVSGHESLEKPFDDLEDIRLENISLRVEVDVLRMSYRDLRSICKEREESIIQIQQQKVEFLKQNTYLLEAIKEVSSEKDRLLDELFKIKDTLGKREEELWREKEEMKKELESCIDKIKKFSDEKTEIIRVSSDNLETVKLIKKGLLRLIESVEEDDVGILDKVDKGERDELKLEGAWVSLLQELKAVTEFVNKVELKMEEYKEKRKKERKEKESSIVSLTEENRDINRLLRIALAEKEAVDKSLNKFKGKNEQKRAAILQIAERGLQRVGFSFMVGAAGNEQSPENSGANKCVKSDSSECEEEVAGLASSMEKIMKNLRLEITQLRRSLDESRYLLLPSQKG